MPWTTQPMGRSISVNGGLIRHHREELGLSQEKFAGYAGYSTRLIAKAESGGSLNPDTIDVLAEALSSPTKTVFPEDLVFFPKKAAWEILESYAKYEEHCVAQVRHLIAGHVVVSVPGDPSVLPFAGEYQTIDGFNQFLQKFFSILERPDKELLLSSAKVVADGNRVIILTQERCTHMGQTDSENPLPLGFVFEFERGQLVRFEDHFDVTGTAESIKKITAKEAARDAEQNGDY